MQKLESLKNAKFNSLSTDEMDKINGGRKWVYRGTYWSTNSEGVCVSSIYLEQINWAGNVVDRNNIAD